MGSFLSCLYNRIPKIKAEGNRCCDNDKISCFLFASITQNFYSYSYIKEDKNVSN